MLKVVKQLFGRLRVVKLCGQAADERVVGKCCAFCTNFLIGHLGKLQVSLAHNFFKPNTMIVEQRAFVPDLCSFNLAQTILPALDWHPLHASYAPRGCVYSCACACLKAVNSLYYY